MPFSLFEFSPVTIAYMSFFVAEILCETSGVIAVVFCGITTQAFGSNMINDQHMMESFWEVRMKVLATIFFLSSYLTFFFLACRVFIKHPPVHFGWSCVGRSRCR